MEGISPEPIEEFHERIARLHARIEDMKRLIQEAEDKAAILQGFIDERERRLRQARRRDRD